MAIKSKYYNADELLSRHFPINFICGDRFGGKSTCVQRYVIKRAVQYFKDRKNKQQEFAILTRYDKDISMLCATYFDNTMAQWYPDYVLTFSSKKFWLALKSNPDDKLLVGYGFALNQATKMKSTSYPYITTMILEEFMNLEGKYIKSASNPDLEVELLISIYSTIARGNGAQVRDNVRVLCVSNNFYINNPYFRYFNLINDIVQNPFKRFYIKNTEPQCCVEMTHNDVHLSIGRDDINKGNKFVDMQHDLKILKNFNIKELICQLTFDNKTFVNLCNINDSVGAFVGDTIRSDYVYSCSEVRKAGMMNITAFKPTDTYKVLKTIFEQNNIYYDKLETYITLYNILHFSPGK